MVAGIRSRKQLLFVAAFLPALARAFLLQDIDSCVNRCGTNVDRGASCQCNDHCTRYQDCCPDYSTLCVRDTSSCSNVLEVTRQMWMKDTNRFTDSEIVVNYQSSISNSTDSSTQRLFTYVNTTRLASPTYQSFINLLNNYQPLNGQPEITTQTELAEQNVFLDEILGTEVMITLLDYLKCEGIVSTQGELKTKLRTIWFDQYPRNHSSQVKDTSGFEHVMVGEYKDSARVNGFHNWLAFYLYERDGDINYFGYFRQENPGLVSIAFSWNTRVKALTSFSIGSSPEFDIALYTLCFIKHPNNDCAVNLGGKNFTVHTYRTGDHLATAYIAL